MAFNSTRYFAEFISAVADVVETGTATIVITTTGVEQVDFIFSGTASIAITTTGIASENGNQTITITTTTSAIGVGIADSQTITITGSGVENLGYFDSGTGTIVIFTEGRAKVHAFDTYKDGLQNLRIA